MYRQRRDKKRDSGALGHIRRGQAITTNGVGSLLLADKQSFIVAGLDEWSRPIDRIEEPRLLAELRNSICPDLKSFYMPNASGKYHGQDIPVFRFPRMHYCPECGSLKDHSDFCDEDKNICNECHVGLVPSRFVVICDRGHINDFPYSLWVHRGPLASEGHHRLRLVMKGESTSLSDIHIECSCGAKRTMEGAFGEGALKQIVGCSGNMPWIRSFERCYHPPRVVRRGASNIFYPLVVSSLSIPPWSNAINQFIDQHWSSFNNPSWDDNTLRNLVKHMMREHWQCDKIDIDRRLQDYRIILDTVRERRGLELDIGASSSTKVERRRVDEIGLRTEEFKALCRGSSEDQQDVVYSKGGAIYRSEFVCHPPLGKMSEDLTRWFEQVMIVEKLREVRAFTSFTRLYPAGSGDERSGEPARISINPPTWLPGMLVRGEGIFLRMNRSTLAGWEKRDAVKQRVSRLSARLGKDYNPGSLGVRDESISPRLLALHTLAHILIRQLSMDCGYPVSSLRERLYVSCEEGQEMEGILIHTSTGDVAGSLGGLIELGEPDRLRDVFMAGIESASWCSADPSCIESVSSGINGSNIAACHSCAILPETSCERFNRLLDRGLLVGTPEHPELGLFSELIKR